MDNKKASFLRSSLIYSVFAVFLLWLIFYNEFAIGDFGRFLPYLPEQLASMNLDVLLIPIFASISIFYIASLIGKAFEGRLSQVLGGTLYAAGFATFFALFLILNPTSTLSSAGYLVLVAFIIILTYNILSTLSRLRENLVLRVLAVSATIYLEGQIAIRLLTLFLSSSKADYSPEIISGVGQFLNLGVSIAAIFTLFAIFKKSGNSYLSALGGIASNYLFSISLSLIGAIYYGFFMGGLSTLAPSISNLSPYFEWTGICIFAALIFTVMRRGMQGSMMSISRMGGWKKHVQMISVYKGDSFVNFTEVIDGFLENGNRDRLLVSLALFLHENRVEEDEISNLLSDLINFQGEDEPIFSRRGRTEVIDKKNRERRMEVLKKTIDNIIPMGLLDLPEPSTTEEGLTQAVPPIEGGA
jgi:hypothetical protein